MKNKHSSIILFLFVSLVGFSQSVDSLYQLADTYSERFSTKIYGTAQNVQALHKSYQFAYETRLEQGKVFYLVDGLNKTQTEAFDHEKMAKSLSKTLNREIKPYALPLGQVRYSKENDTVFFNIGSDSYLIDLTHYKIEKRNNPDRRREGGYWAQQNQENSTSRVNSPDGKKEAYISEGNIWIRDKSNGKSTQISFDGSPYEYYSSSIYWSPDSKKLISCKYRPGSDRKLLLIASSPKDQLQPITEEYDYLKPGDALPIRRPVVFFVDEERSVAFDIPDVELQYDLNRIHWHENSRIFTFNFNKRGHQQYFIYEGDIESGNLRPLVQEKSATFIHYNALYQHWLKENDELLWISERDGWKHLYLYDVAAGKVKKQLTKGEWIVKSVVNVNEETREIIFKGCGMDKQEDPYLEKYYLLNIDSGKIIALTPEDANHNVTFSSDYSYIFDSYSRVDSPPTLVVRSVKDRSNTIYTLENQPNISDVLKTGWQMPEVFSAKGRDGKTDIWGMIIRPANFNPAKTYPVIEYIYAGPHDSHVPKSFSIEHHSSALAELGFITVLIDGMGTANRSKAFHDVCWQDLKDAGFPDRIAWIKAAAVKYPELDIENVGIYGVSAGGQSAMGALLFHPEFYKVGVSSCACHDNRMDKIWWNEQWMGYPIGKHYEASSNMVNAHLLEGKLMLILGELDNNVDPASTLRVVDELIKQDKEFEFVMLPGERHTMGGKYGERKRRDFFVKHILHKETPEWNTQ